MPIATKFHFFVLLLLLTGAMAMPAFGDPDAAAFCASNHITDPAVQSDVTGFVTELKSSGSFALMADGLLLHPRFNPTNKLSFFGIPETATNLAFSSWGASFNGTGGIQLPLTSPVTSNTLVFVYRSPYLTVDTEEFVLGLVNSNTLSADWMWEAGNAGTYEVWERDATTFPNGGSPGSPYDNLIEPRWVNVYSYLEGAARVNQRKVAAMSNDGHGNSQFWQDTVQAQIGYSNPAFTHSSSVVNPDPMNVLCVGRDYTSLSANFGPWTGEMSVVLAFKGVLTQAQVNSVYRAVRWLEPDTVERIYVGDSLTAPDAAGTNNYPQFMQYGRPGENCWHNYAQGGTTALEFTQYPLTAISSLPYPSKVKQIDVYYAFGVNDTYGYGYPAYYVLSYLTNSINAIQALGASVYYGAISQVWTNATYPAPYTYNASYDAAGKAMNQFFYASISNGNNYVAGIIPRDQIVTQPLLNTNNLFSTDGLHFYGPLGPVANQAIADYMLGKPYISGYSISNPNHPVWPYDYFGNVWLNPSTLPPNTTGGAASGASADFVLNTRFGTPAAVGGSASAVSANFTVNTEFGTSLVIGGAASAVSGNFTINTVFGTPAAVGGAAYADSANFTVSTRFGTATAIGGLAFADSANFILNTTGVLHATPTDLGFRLNGSSLSISWSTAAGSFSLQFTTNLNPPNWTTLSNPPATVGTNFVSTIATTNPMEFFRLKSN